ncbi:MAG TPA: hypothetical protein VG604_04300 [Candidatus Saccharimonadales bacterium]|nr:hypothetical protein [Candidatus Saccharimonadales bacterium]
MPEAQPPTPLVQPLPAQPIGVGDSITSQVHTPLSSDQPNAVSPMPNEIKKPKKLKFLPTVIILIILAGGGVFAFMHFSKSNGPALLCIPPSSSSADKSDAEKVYATFAQAIKQKNQTCVDSLSSTYFKKLQLETFGTSNWINVSKSGLASVSSNLAKIPVSFNPSSFTSSDYTEAQLISSGSTSSNADTLSPPTGITLSYSVLDASSKQKIDMDISFVSESGKVVVDYFQLAPAQLKNFNN